MQDHLDMTVMHPPFRLRTGSQRQIVRGRPKPRGSSVWRMDIPGQTDHVHDLASDGEGEGTFKILVQQVVKGMRGTMPIQYFPGLIIDQ
jgi:hypothetical protein